MKLRKHILILIILCIDSSVFLNAQSQSKVVYIITEKSISPRVKFGVDKLKYTLKKYGFDAKQVSDPDFLTKTQVIYISSKDNKKIAGTRIFAKMPKEGFSILSNKNAIFIDGADESGALYGCLELSDRIIATKKIPTGINLKDAPEMVLRGACIGVQKPYYLPGRNVYEYPYTPETFPWFYDKKLWIQYLDSMVANRMNSLYLWNGHPFASLVKLKDYPYALEVDDATFKKNEEIYRFLTTEADKRGIWVIQMFYNIIVSKPFADHHKIKTQERERPITPLIADYTRKSIAAFVEKYPNVGLMVCLGEAMEGVGNDDIEWFTKTIIPGVKDGLKALNKTEDLSAVAEPPIVLRAHDTDAPAVMRASLPLYKNLYTEAKFNGEALTYARPRGTWAELHQTLSKLGSVQIENVHILANLEPFRYGSPDFIQQSVIGMHEVMGGNGLHLYPQASYWDWPYSADSVKGKRLLQIERDWIWYSAWSRYAWKAKRNREEEIVYWSKQLASKFGCSETDGRRILTAYEESGEIAPKLLRRFGITDGNRQTLTLGMLMTQLINPFRYGLFTLLYDAEAPEGEMILDYADKQQKGIKHIGETPPQVAREVVVHGNKAVTSIMEVSRRVTKNKDEFNRIVNDMYCYKAMADHFSSKVQAAVQLLKYKYSGNIADLELAVPMLEKSVNDYKELAALTADTYRYANSMQTQQRKIPMRGVNATFKHWTEMVPVFETELKTFEYKIDSLKNASSSTEKERKSFQQVDVKLNHVPVVLNEGAVIFNDTSLRIKQLAAELKGLKAIQFSYQQQLSQSTEINFYSGKPVKILVGYFKTQRAAFTTDTVFAKAPELETNASADDYGQSEIKISNAIALDGLPPVNIHTYSFKAGTHTLKLPKGVCLVLGFIDGTQVIPVYDAMLMSDAKNKNLDWLFE